MDDLFGQIDFGSLDAYLKNDDVTDISYTNNGQLWIKTLSKGIYREENKDVTNALMEKIAFQCSNIMGKTFNAASPFWMLRVQKFDLILCMILLPKMELHV